MTTPAFTAHDGVTEWSDEEENDVTLMLWPFQSHDLQTIEPPVRKYLSEEWTLRDLQTHVKRGVGGRSVGSS